MYKLLIIIASMWFAALFPSIASASGEICVDGFGVVGDNGTYTIAGTAGGHNYYTNGAAQIGFSPTYQTWYINTDTPVPNDPPTYGDYYDGNGHAAPTTPDLVLTWYSNGGASPIGTIIAGTCGGGEGPPPDTQPPLATSTPDQTQTNLFYGLTLFTVYFFFMVYAFSR